MNNQSVDRVIPREELRALINVSKSTEWRMLQNNSLPKTVVVNGRILGYLMSSYLKWLADNS